jgi:hypothetical protein
MNTQSKVGLESTVVAIKDQISADLAGEIAILNVKSGIYYGLNPVGASVWKLIQEPKTVSQVRDALLKEYDVQAERCEKDLLNLLERLEGEKLVELRNETPS